MDLSSARVGLRRSLLRPTACGTTASHTVHNVVLKWLAPPARRALLVSVQVFWIGLL